jgi:chitinase
LRSSCAADVNSHNKIVVCYVNSWAAKRSGNGKFLVENIDPMLCTHIIYAFAELDEDTHSIYSRYSDIDLEEDGGKGIYFKN